MATLLLAGAFTKAHAAEGTISITGGDLLKDRVFATEGQSSYATGNVAGSVSWRISTRVSLGFRGAIRIASIPYGYNDGELVAFRRVSDHPYSFERKTTAFQSLSFLARFDTGMGFSLDSFLGHGWAQMLLPEFVLLSFGVGAEVELVSFGATSLRARVQLEAMATSPYGDVLYVRQAGLTLAF